MKYTSLLIVGNSYRTEDGYFHSRSDSKGYSYWYDRNGIRQGSTSFDYFFFTGEEGVSRALEVLNSQTY